MASYFHSKLVHYLKNGHFSLIIDETTDISTKKELALVTRQYNKESMSVTCSLYVSSELIQGNAEAIFENIFKEMQKPFLRIYVPFWLLMEFHL